MTLKYKLNLTFYVDDKKIYKLIDCLGIKSFDSLTFLDSNLKIIYKYDDYMNIQFYENANKTGKKFIRKFIKSNKNVSYINFKRD